MSVHDVEMSQFTRMRCNGRAMRSEEENGDEKGRGIDGKRIKSRVASASAGMTLLDGQLRSRLENAGGRADESDGVELSGLV